MLLGQKQSQPHDITCLHCSGCWNDWMLSTLPSEDCHFLLVIWFVLLLYLLCDPWTAHYSHKLLGQTFATCLTAEIDKLVGYCTIFVTSNLQMSIDFISYTSCWVLMFIHFLMICYIMWSTALWSTSGMWYIWCCLATRMKCQLEILISIPLVCTNCRVLLLFPFLLLHGFQHQLSTWSGHEKEAPWAPCKLQRLSSHHQLTDLSQLGSLDHHLRYDVFQRLL